MYDIEGVTYSVVSGDRNYDKYSVVTASTQTTGVLVQHILTTNAEGSACTYSITSDVMIIDVPIDDDTMTKGLYGEDRLNEFDPFIILLLSEGSSETRQDTVTVSLEGVITYSDTNQVVDVLPSLPSSCSI